MPDWTYRTLLKPVLRVMPREHAHTLVLRSLARLARMPLGPQILEFFGHMQPDSRLRVSVAGRLWATPIGLGADLDPEGIASTRVVLPYDEVWCSTTRAGLAAINPRLLPFLAHDRVTLAGTMISIGGLYLGLAMGAVRLGAHWAQRTVIYSASTGFLSFFLFLGFGYFDPFHALVTAILFQFLVMAIYAVLPKPRSVGYPDLHETAAWRRGQWGQLLFVTPGISPRLSWRPWCSELLRV